MTCCCAAPAWACCWPRVRRPNCRASARCARTRLGWDETRWREEAERYQTLWQQCYSLPTADHDELDYA